MKKQAIQTASFSEQIERNYSEWQERGAPNE